MIEGAPYSVVPTSEVKGRLDAEFYEDFEFFFRLKKRGISLNDLGFKAIRDPMCYGFPYVKKGVPYLRVDDLDSPFLSLANTVYITEETNNQYAKTRLKYKDIVFAVRGATIGRLGIYYGENYRCNISPNLMALRLSNPELADFVAITLLSEILLCAYMPFPSKHDLCACGGLVAICPPPPVPCQRPLVPPLAFACLFAPVPVYLFSAPRSCRLARSGALRWWWLGVG